MEAVQRIEFHHRYETDRPRNEGRVWLKVRLADEIVTPAVIGGHKIDPGKDVTIEVYQRDVPRILAMVRTDEHKRVITAAKRMAAAAAQRWIDDRVGKPVGDPSSGEIVSRERAELECPIHWAQRAYIDAAAASLGVSLPNGGVPPLEKCEVVRDDVEPPDTPENLATKSAKTQAEVIADAMKLVLTELRSDRQGKHGGGR